jgi:acylphosphatase
MERLEATVTGKVQGVMYRDFVQRAAERLGLTGTVANLVDGSVEVIAEGERGILEALITELQNGPFYAEVKDVSPAFRAATREFSRFDIIKGKG